jgi:hypothetical protein
MFKRHQVEEAIASVIGPGSVKPSSEMRTRAKRLLETDRGLGRNKRAADPERGNLAFYSVDAPGRGVEIWFSDYEAFALLTGLQLMQHGWPQRFAVGVLRRVRPELEIQHAWILKQDPAVLFDQQLIRARAKPGDLAVHSTQPVFLVIRSGDREDRSAAICRGPEELMPFIRSQGVGQPWTVFELGKSAHDLSSALAKTRPRRRGRPSKAKVGVRA